MPQYRKKQVIEAEQWLNTDYQYKVLNRAGVIATGTREEACFLYTADGTLRCEYLDYIVTAADGTRYPCKPDIFEAAYELVHD